MCGWIKLHRKTLDWEWYSDTNVKIVFLHLLLTSNYKPSRFKGLEVDRGQVVIGRKELAKQLSLSEMQIRTCLSKLKSTNDITIAATNQFSVVTLVNYDAYQVMDSEQPAKQPAEHLTDNQRITTSKEVKNIRSKDTNVAIAPSCPHQEIVNLYKEILHELPTVKVWNDSRKKLLSKRWKEDKERQNIDYWQRLFKYISESNFLMGRSSDFQASLPWIINPTNFAKIIEGNYTNREN